MERERLGSSAGFLCFVLRHAIVQRVEILVASDRFDYYLQCPLDIMESLIG
jgi:hypothetical protein